MLPGLDARASRRFLLVLCVMYFILYVDRVNLAGAASTIQKDLKLSNTELGIAFSAFNYSYAAFQIVGGWISDRFGARLTLAVCALIWAVTTMATGAVGGLVSLCAVRLVLGMGEGATLPAATRAMTAWASPKDRGFYQGITHSASRLGAAATAPVVAFLIAILSWRLSFVVLGGLSALWSVLWLWSYREGPDRSDSTIDRRSVEPVPWRRLIPRIMPTVLTYFTVGWTGWLMVTWMPSLFLHNYGLDLKSSALFSSATFLAAMVGDTVGGVVSDAVLRRTGNLRLARSGVVSGSLLASVCSLIPTLVVHDLTIDAVCFSLAFFFLEAAIAPIWAVSMDITPEYAGTASAMVNCGAAVAGIVSPVVFGRILDLTGNWTLPFAVSIGLLLFGVVISFWMRPDRPLLIEPRAVSRVAAAV